MMPQFESLCLRVPWLLELVFWGLGDYSTEEGEGKPHSSNGTPFIVFWNQSIMLELALKITRKGKLDQKYSFVISVQLCNTFKKWSW